MLLKLLHDLGVRIAKYNSAMNCSRTAGWKWCQTNILPGTSPINIVEIDMGLFVYRHCTPVFVTQRVVPFLLLQPVLLYHYYPLNNSLATTRTQQTTNNYQIHTNNLLTVN